jgi:hypothetical protein
LPQEFSLKKKGLDHGLKPNVPPEYQRKLSMKDEITLHHRNSIRKKPVMRNISSLGPVVEKLLQWAAVNQAWLSNLLPDALELVFFLGLFAVYLTIQSTV